MRRPTSETHLTKTNNARFLFIFLCGPFKMPMRLLILFQSVVEDVMLASSVIATG